MIVVPEPRALLGIGIAGSLLIFLTLRRDDQPLVTGRLRIPALVAIAAILLLYFLHSRAENPLFLSNTRFLFLLATVTILGAAYPCTKPVIFGSIFASVLLLNNFLVNPIVQGLPSLIESSAAKHVAAIYKGDPNAAWAGYESVTLPQFIIATGARVLNGVKVVPDLDFLNRIDTAGSNRDIYNRYAHIVFRLPSTDEIDPRFELASVDAYRVMVAPTNPALRSARLKYVVFPRRLGEAEMAGMKLVDAIAGNQIFIYKLD